MKQLMRIHSNQQLIELVEKSKISTISGVRHTKYNYSDRHTVKQSIRTATVDSLRKAIRELELEPAPAPEYHAKSSYNYTWKTGSKEELVRRVYLAWESRYGEAFKAEERAREKRAEAKRKRSHAEKLLTEALELECDASDLDEFAKKDRKSRGLSH